MCRPQEPRGPHRCTPGRLPRGLADREYALRPLYSQLDHPRLAHQLRGTIADRGKHDRVRRVAIAIAAACNCQKLSGELVRVALDQANSLGLRTEAALAVAAV